MVATYDNSGDFTLDFTPIPDAIPPQNIEIEETVLGGILLDPACIHSLKSRLKPEHFYLASHRQLYKACLAVAKKGLLPDLMQLTAYLIDKKLLQEIGGRNKLANLVNCTISATNIDQFAQVLIQKHARRELIKLGNDVTKFAYSSEIELEDVLDLVRRRTETAINLDAAKTQDEIIKDNHDRLINKLKRIFTTTVEPSLKYLKLKYLADESCVSISFLENLYLKSLVGTCTQLMDYDDLKELAGSSVRQWVQQGLIPKSSTILLAADGGIGKTKFIYSVAKNLITGENFGDFSATGNKRKILFYQGDEQPGDMLQSLQMLGYEENDVNKFIKMRFGWSFENMATLIKDLNEFKPDFVLFDSMSFGQRFCNHKEGDSEFARPILECTGLAVEHKCSFLFIHHTNKGGDVRGTTAIRNAVSEVWRLSKDNKPEATPYDRILEIDKSRSRSSGKRYRLYFNPDNLGFVFLGEELQADDDKDSNLRSSLLGWLRSHPNTKYTSEELSHYVLASSGSVRRTISQLSSDGLVSVERKPGKAYLYYLDFAECGVTPMITSEDHLHKPGTTRNIGENIADHNECGVTPMITSEDHLHKPDTTRNTGKGDPLILKNESSNKNKNKNEVEKIGSADHLCSKDLPDKTPGGDPIGDHGCNPSSLLSPIKSLFKTEAGDLKAIATQLDVDNWEFKLLCPDGTESSQVKQISEDAKNTVKDNASKCLQQTAKRWIKKLRFNVIRPMGVGKTEVVEGCKLIDKKTGFRGSQWIFESPEGKTINVFHQSDFELQVNTET